MRRSKSFCLAILFLILAGCAAKTTVYQDPEQLHEAEKFALFYMEALHGGEIRAAAELTHPENIAGMHRGLTKEIKRQRIEGTHKIFLIYVVNLSDDVDTLLNLTPFDFYVKVLEAQWMKNSPDAREAMKRAEISVKKSRMVSTDTAEVRLEIITPTKRKISTQRPVVLLTRHDDSWRATTRAALRDRTSNLPR